MGVYRGLDIVADKPSMDERQRRSSHHLFDVADPDEDFTAPRYRTLARAAIDDIAARGAVPMLVGGSGLYFRAVVDELEFAPTSAEVRARLEAEDPDVLYARLREARSRDRGAARPAQRASRRPRRRGAGAHRTSAERAADVWERGAADRTSSSSRD